MRSLIVLAISLFLAPPGMLVSGQTISVRDRSDWWSILNEGFQTPQATGQKGTIDEANFQISGVTLGSGQFEKASLRLDKAKVVRRGDGSSGREQVCYVPPDGKTKVHLIFEFGEVESAFYLFSGGPYWKGSGFCRKSSQLSTDLKAASGLRLGLSRSQLEAILGKPDVVVGNRLVYSREVNKKTSAEEFEQLRNEYPEKLSNEVAHKKFDFQSVVIYIEARFSGSKLTYLAVSRTT